MHGNIRRGRKIAIKVPIRTDSDKCSTVQTDSEDHAWFTEPARDLLGSDPGLALAVLTGISDSSGYRYANGSRSVPGWLLRGLLRSPQGRPWLNAIMHGSDEPWWLELQRAERIAAAIDAVEVRP